MADLYRYANEGNSIVLCTEDGEPVQVIHELVAELNRLARLVDETANFVRLTERTKVEHTLKLQNLYPDELKEQTSDEFTVVYVTADLWNRVVRAIKALDKTWRGT